MGDVNVRNVLYLQAPDERPDLTYDLGISPIAGEEDEEEELQENEYEVVFSEEENEARRLVAWQAFQRMDALFNQLIERHEAQEALENGSSEESDPMAANDGVPDTETDNDGLVSTAVPK